ncbi:hypothetical protein GE061_002976 [Apolygus lucorum]|uniref:Major facilitator superfamily (MFS) profile domain-containing protein n=1 Tax=Apolygus lucorum TaxID=248454 RepID=A0A8S9X2H6_APOLU|nr:hypothetical protein GE061_002976 [Apolygus lucorum]
MVTVYGDEEPATQEQATPIRFDTGFEQPENLSLDQYIDAAVERAIRKLDAPVATMIRSFNATPDRHENMTIATPQRLNDTVMVTPHQHDNTVVATPNRHVATVVATPKKMDTDLDTLMMLKEEKKTENTPDTQIEKIVTQRLKSLMQIEGAHADRSPKNDKNVQNDEKMGYGWSIPAAVAPAPVPTTSSKEHTPRTPREEASTQHSTPSELDRDMDADHNFDRSTERETERSKVLHGTDDPQTSRADRHETPLCHTTHHDNIGRRPSFFIYLFIECFFGIATAFAPDFLTWTLFRIGVGFTVPAILGTPYVLAIELVGPSSRTMVTIMTNIAYSLGLMALAVIAYLVRDWRALALATSVPFLTFFLYWWVLPESPRWLLARGRFDEAEKILNTMARVNGRTLPPDFIMDLKRQYHVERYVKEKDDAEGRTRTYGVSDLFRTPNLRRKTVIITFIWFTNTSVYVGLSYYASILSGDEFLNFLLAGAVELPTYLVLWPSMQKLGRRWTVCISMLVGGSACLATVLSQQGESLHTS